MNNEFIAAFTISLLFIALFAYIRLIGETIIFDNEKGLFYKNGKFVKILSAGKHHYLKKSSKIQLIDIRKKTITIPGQEIFTKDNLTIKISLTGNYEIIDARKALHNSENYILEIYNTAQMLLRTIIGNYELDELLQSKSAVDEKLIKGIKSPAGALGLEFHQLALKDIMLPSNLKNSYSGVAQARKDSLKQLEKARGEQAVLRKLANFSNMFEEHPSLLQARLIQVVAETSGNSIVFGSNEVSRVTKKKSTKK